MAVGVLGGQLRLAHAAQAGDGLGQHACGPPGPAAPARASSDVAAGEVRVAVVRQVPHRRQRPREARSAAWPTGAGERRRAIRLGPLRLSPASSRRRASVLGQPDEVDPDPAAVEAFGVKRRHPDRHELAGVRGARDRRRLPPHATRARRRRRAPRARAGRWSAPSPRPPAWDGVPLGHTTRRHRGRAAAWPSQTPLRRRHEPQGAQEPSPWDAGRRRSSWSAEAVATA